jgi:hypothetical protein
MWNLRLAFQAGKSFAGWRLSAYAGNILALHTRERPANKHHILWPLALSGYPLSGKHANAYPFMRF